ncbi:hypothetical protein [Neorhizobium sp. AL 9.2.2]|uniref:hypothetical protein n=1 Tax=Neorhizobium sp. AL 9.2.2 TaxID=2712894 RepID=UPI001574BFE3|nr:hypothetical protein [Neorhizobium sp. AL 9.2.2]NSY17227.1 hypothetical protein [Neorhizobium sp. AL 9.2.2]
MKEGWYERLVDLIEADPRDYKVISQAAKLGQNYVQQMVKDGKQPTIDRFLAIMSALGSHHIMYVLTGERKAEPQEPVVALRSAMLAYGVDRSQLTLAVSIVDRFVSPEAEEPPAQSQPDDQSQPASRHRVSTP